jgi:hypothetical protein
MTRSSPSLYIPAHIGLVHGRIGFVRGYHRLGELIVEGSSVAGSYSQPNHIENCALFHPPSVLSNVDTAQPRDNYPLIVSIPDYAYYCL